MKTAISIVTHLILSGFEISIIQKQIRIRGKRSLTYDEKNAVTDLSEKIILLFKPSKSFRLGQLVCFNGTPARIWEIYSTGRMGLIRDGHQFPFFIDQSDINLNYKRDVGMAPVTQNSKKPAGKKEPDEN